MADAPIVSVIITSYNYARYLPDCVNSVLEQTYPHWEAIIVDDGSTDETPVIAAELAGVSPERIRYLRIENSGVANARNVGIGASCGEYLLPLDADDMLVPEAIEVFLKTLQEHPESGYAYSAVENYQCLAGDSRTWFPGPFFLRWLLNENNAACTALWRRSLWDAGVRYQELIHEDWDLWLQIAARGYSGIYVPLPLLRYRMHSDGRHSTNRHVYYLAFLQEVRSHPQLYPEPLRRVAEQVLKNVPGCLALPSVVFLLGESADAFGAGRGALSQLADSAVTRGMFVAAVGPFESVLAREGIALLRGDPSDFESMVDRLGMLGRDLIVFHDFDPSMSPRIRLRENVRGVVSSCGRLDSAASLSLAVSGDALALLEGGEARPISPADLIELSMFTAATAPNPLGVFVARMRNEQANQRGTLPESRVLPAVDDLHCLILQDGRERGESSIARLARVLPSAATSEVAALGGMISNEKNSHDSTSERLNRSIAGMNAGSGEWLLILEEGTLCSARIFEEFSHWRHVRPEQNVFFAEGVRMLPGSQVPSEGVVESPKLEPWFPASVETACMFIRRHWLEQVDGFLSGIQSWHGLVEFVNVCLAKSGEAPLWLSPGTLGQSWQIPLASREWRDYDSQRIRQWKLDMLNGAGFGRVPSAPDRSVVESVFGFAVQHEHSIRSSARSSEELGHQLAMVGVEALRRGQPLQARALFEDSIAAEPRNPEGWVGFGHAVLQLGAFQLAGHAAARALFVAPEYRMARELLDLLRNLLEKGGEG